MMDQRSASSWQPGGWKLHRQTACTQCCTVDLSTDQHRMHVRCSKADTLSCNASGFGWLTLVQRGDLVINSQT